MSRKLVPPSCIEYVCDRFITKRKWRNKTSLFFFQWKKSERPIKLIHSNNHKVGSMLSLSIYSFFFFYLYIYICMDCVNGRSAL
jgi:hypothetical protein